MIDYTQKDVYMARMAISKSLIERGSFWSQNVEDEAKEWVKFIMTGNEISDYDQH